MVKKTSYDDDNDDDDDNDGYIIMGICNFGSVHQIIALPISTFLLGNYLS